MKTFKFRKSFNPNMLSAIDNTKNHKDICYGLSVSDRVRNLAECLQFLLKIDPIPDFQFKLAASNFEHIKKYLHSKM